MPKHSLKCAKPGCHRRLKMTHQERIALREHGLQHQADASLICPEHVLAVFDFQDQTIEIDVPLEEYLVESLRQTPQWRVLLTPWPPQES